VLKFKKDKRSSFEELKRYLQPEINMTKTGEKLKFIYYFEARIDSNNFSVPLISVFSAFPTSIALIAHSSASLKLFGFR
jgi:hypothetical protein